MRLHFDDFCFLCGDLIIWWFDNLVIWRFSMSINRRDYLVAVSWPNFSTSTCHSRLPVSIDSLPDAISRRDLFAALFPTGVFIYIFFRSWFLAFFFDLCFPFLCARLYFVSLTHFRSRFALHFLWLFVRNSRVNLFSGREFSFAYFRWRFLFTTTALWRTHMFHSDSK